MRGAAFCLLAGCWSTAPVAPVAPTSHAPGVTVDGTTSSPAGGARAAARREPFPLHSVWQGTYVCNQGLSSVTLTIDSDRAGNANARYDFGPVPSNPGVPVGAYLMTGTLTKQDGGGFTGVFETTEWVIHPPNYFMVPLSVESGDGKTMTGKIQHASCHSFETRRIE